MDTFSTISNLLTAALSIWASKEKTKYVDQKLSLEKDWYAEFNKPENERSNLVLDNCMLQLRILANNVTNDITKSTAILSNN